jgi:hypothetical protein
MNLFIVRSETFLKKKICGFRVSLSTHVILQPIKSLINEYI